MQLKARPLDLDSGGKFVVVINRENADEMGLGPLDRVKIVLGRKYAVGIADTTDRVVPKDTLGTSNEVTRALGIEGGEDLEVVRVRQPDSVQYIKEKINDKPLNYEKIKAIVEDVAQRRLARAEIASFLTAICVNPLTMEEVEYLTRSMTAIGGRLNLRNGPVFDKHSVGGACGDKTTILVVPIVAAAGLTIPKTSSRAITSPAGTADRVETLTNVNLSIEEMKRVVHKTKGCMVWGGSLDLSPADDVFIQVEYPLGIDPLLLPSVMSKKKAVGADNVVIDIPVGSSAKIRTEDEARELAYSFIELGKRVGVKVKCAMTYAEQPIGRAVGPALEGREALMTVCGESRPEDLLDKATSIAGLLLEMGGKKDGKALAEKILSSGKAERKLRQIIGEQGGNAKIRSRDIAIGDNRVDIKSNDSGYVLVLRNSDIASISRAAGAPRDKGAGIYLNRKLGDRVKKGDTLFSIYAEKASKMEHALEVLGSLDTMIIGSHGEMLLKTFPGVKEERYFFLER